MVPFVVCYAIVLVTTLLPFVLSMIALFMIVLFMIVLSVIVLFMMVLHMIRQAAASDWRSSMRVWQSDLPKGRRMLVKRGTFAS